MNPDSHYSDNGGARRHRQLVWRAPIVRYAVLVVAGCLATGCAHDVTVQNPRTGTTEVCRESMGGLNPWSQTTGCVADHIAQGWTRADQE